MQHTEINAQLLMLDSRLQLRASLTALELLFLLALGLLPLLALVLSTSG